MGEARKRRLTLIKDGKTDQAKALYVAPERLTNLTIQLPTLKANVAAEIYATKVDKKTCPTPNDFFKAVFEAGMIEFERYYIQENEKPALPAGIEILPYEGSPDPIRGKELNESVSPEEGGEA